MRNVDISELEGLQNDINSLVRQMPAEVERIVTDGGRELKGEIDQRTQQIYKTGGYHSANTLNIEVGYEIAAEVVNQAPHAHLIEYGTGPRWQRGGRFTGEMPELAPYRSAFDENEGRISGNITTQALSLIERRLTR